VEPLTFPAARCCVPGCVASEIDDRVIEMPISLPPYTERRRACTPHFDSLAAIGFRVVEG